VRPEIDYRKAYLGKKGRSPSLPVQKGQINCTKRVVGPHRRTTLKEWIPGLYQEKEEDLCSDMKHDHAVLTTSPRGGNTGAVHSLQLPGKKEGRSSACGGVRGLRKKKKKRTFSFPERPYSY